MQPALPLELILLDALRILASVLSPKFTEEQPQILRLTTPN